MASKSENIENDAFSDSPFASYWNPVIFPYSAPHHWNAPIVDTHWSQIPFASDNVGHFEDFVLEHFANVRQLKLEYIGGAAVRFTQFLGAMPNCQQFDIIDLVDEDDDTEENGIPLAIQPIVDFLVRPQGPSHILIRTKCAPNSDSIEQLVGEVKKVCLSGLLFICRLFLQRFLAASSPIDLKFQWISSSSSNSSSDEGDWQMDSFSVINCEARQRLELKFMANPGGPHLSLTSSKLQEYNNKASTVTAVFSHAF